HPSLPPCPTRRSSDLVDLEAEAPGERHRAADLRPALGRGGKAERAHLLPVDRLAGRLLQPVEDGDRVLHEAGEVALAAELTDERSEEHTSELQSRENL